MKFYIAWPLPEIYHPSIAYAQILVDDILLKETKRMPAPDLHITALYIGEATMERAKDLMNVVHGCIAETGFKGYESFRNRQGPNALVISMSDKRGHLQSAHDALVRNSGLKQSFKYNPHLTIAKATVPDFGMKNAATYLNNGYPMHDTDFTLERAVLYGKVDGAEYTKVL